MHKNDMYSFENNDGQISGSFSLPSGALVSEYLEYLGVEANRPKPEYSVKTVFSGSDKKDTPFISVVTRTQGKRLEELEEMLLCLSGQSSTDFELVLVGHNITDEQSESIRSLLVMQPEWLRNRILFITVEGGGRARPLNAAFPMTTASYITILDDDDIVFDNWIEAFYEAAQVENGKILHSFVFTQKWCVTESIDGERFLAADGSPEPTYCEEFDYYAQLSMNACPTMGLAYPRFLFSVFNLTFDESLTTTEDWDYLMRAYPICGVFDTTEPVAIYRLWESNENSHELHDEVEWEANRTFIQEKLNNRPLLLPPGKVEGIVSENEGYHHYSSVNPKRTYLIATLEPNKEEPKPVYPEKLHYNQRSKVNMLEFSGEDIDSSCNTIHLYPYHHGPVTLEDFVMEIKFMGGEVRIYSILDFDYSGDSLDENTLALYGQPPWMRLSLGSKVDIASVTVSYKLRKGIAENLLTGTRLIVRLKEKIRRLRKRFGK